MKKFLSIKLNVFILTLTLLCCSFSPFYAYSCENEGQSSPISDTDYLLMSDLIYCDLQSVTGKKIHEFIKSTKILENGKRVNYKNGKKSVSVADVMDKHIGEWIVDKCFINDTTGFYAAAFKNEALRQIVISVRGTTDAVGKDGANDIEFGMLAVNPPQVIDAIELINPYKKANSSYSFSATGHSLGGGIAMELSQYHNIPAYTFNAAQITETLYYENWQYLADSYSGFDLWKQTDHINEQDFVVGTYDYGISKNSVKHQNQNKINTFFAHAVNHMITIDEQNCDIELSPVVGECDTTHLNQIIQKIKDEGSLILDSSKSNYLHPLTRYSITNVLYGGDGNDAVDAGSGRGRIIGGAGNDLLIGGADNDIYVYYDGDRTDIIADTSGFDELLVNTDKEVTVEENDMFFLIKADGSTIAKIDKTVRTDGFAGKPENENKTQAYSTFSVKVINSSSHTQIIDLKSSSVKKNKMNKIVYKSDCNAAIKDKNGNVVYRIDNSVTEKHSDSYSVYCYYNETDKSYIKFVFISDPELSLSFSDITDELEINIERDNADFSTDLFYYSEKNDFDLSFNQQNPSVHSGSSSKQLQRLEYTMEALLGFKNTMKLMREGTNGKIPEIKCLEGVSKSDVELYSTDTSVLQINDDNSITALKTGQATIVAKEGENQAYCRVYVTSPAYMTVLILIVILLGGIALYLAFLIIKHSAKSVRRRRERKKGKIQINKEEEKSVK